MFKIKVFHVIEGTLEPSYYYGLFYRDSYQVNETKLITLIIVICFVTGMKQNSLR